MNLPKCLALALPAVAFSLSSSANDTEEMTVTASRVSSSLISAALPVEVISEIELENRQSLSMADVLRGRNTVAVAQSGPVGGITELRLRGAEANHVQVRMDGIVLNDPAIGSSVDLAHLNLIGVRQIELLRGAQSGVWGSDALAGVINLSSRPAQDTQTGRLSVEGGSDETYSGAANLSAAGASGYYSLSANHFRTDGTNASLEGNEDDGYRNTTGHLVAGYDAGRWGVESVFRYTDARTEFDPTPFPDFVPSDGDYDLEVEQTYAKLAARYDTNEHWRHTVTYHYLDTDNENVVDGVTSDTTRGGRDLFGYQTDLRFAALGLDQRVTVAYEHAEEDYQQRGTPSFFGDPNFDEDLDIDSFIAEYDVTWGDLVAIASLRYDDNSEFDNDTTYRVATRYTIGATGTTVFAGYGKGSKNPTFTERFGFTPDTFIGNPDLDPEESTSLNLGLEQVFGAFGSVRVALFRDRLKDEIDGFFFDPAQGGFTAVNRPGTSRREGVELASRWSLPWGVIAEFDYSYLDATEPDASGGDQDELRRPEHTGRVLLAYERSDRWSAQIGAAFVGERDDIDFGAFQPVSLGSYTLLHAAARLRLSEHLSLHARVENAADEDYQDVFGYRSPGRRFMLGVSAEL